ncbi:hypothetical protein HHUSO_G4420 [Huso huso]|uniref:Ig-like domain-containing protein n=1 Tax=Huso huso TaxID=61971 RepID=A0ABR1A4Z4_HUSHU
MMLWCSFIFFGSLIYGVFSVSLEQSQISATRKTTKRATFSCKVVGVNINDAYIHWYRQRPGEGLKRILYYQNDGKYEYDQGFNKDHFKAEKLNEGGHLQSHYNQSGR